MTDVIEKIIEITVALLFLGAAGPAIATGLNATSAAFTGFTGVSSIISILPLLLIVSTAFALFKLGQARGYL